MNAPTRRPNVTVWARRSVTGRLTPRRRHHRGNRVPSPLLITVRMSRPIHSLHPPFDTSSRGRRHRHKGKAGPKEADLRWVGSRRWAADGGRPAARAAGGAAGWAAQVRSPGTAVRLGTTVSGGLREAVPGGVAGPAGRRADKAARLCQFRPDLPMSQPRHSYPLFRPRRCRTPYGEGQAGRYYLTIGERD